MEKIGLNSFHYIIQVGTILFRGIRQYEKLNTLTIHMSVKHLGMWYMFPEEFADKMLSYIVRWQYEGMSTSYKTILKYLNMGFTIMFSIECTLKLIGCGKVTSGPGCHTYFSFLTHLQQLLEWPYILSIA